MKDNRPSSSVSFWTRQHITNHRSPIPQCKLMEHLATTKASLSNILHFLFIRTCEHFHESQCGVAEGSNQQEAKPGQQRFLLRDSNTEKHRDNLECSQKICTYRSGEYLLQPLRCRERLGFAPTEAVFKFIQRLPHGIGVGDLGVVHKRDVPDTPALRGDGRSGWVSGDTSQGFPHKSLEGFWSGPAS